MEGAKLQGDSNNLLYKIRANNKIVISPDSAVKYRAFTDDNRKCILYGYKLNLLDTKSLLSFALLYLTLLIFLCFFYITLNQFQDYRDNNTTGKNQY